VSLLFSYGTLQLADVQRATFGRRLQGSPDALAGYRLEPLVIGDPDVVRLSGKPVHSIAVPTGDPADRVPGTVFELDAEELAACDAYEVADYCRVEAQLESGRRAFVYVASRGAARVGG